MFNTAAIRKKIICLTVLLTGCASVTYTPEAYLEKKNVFQYVPSGFQHCRGYGCQFISDVSLDAEDWAALSTVFHAQASTAKKERGQIRQAIGVFEQRVGALTGTGNDKYGTFQKLGSYQLDCVDESVNTTVYLLLLKQKGWVRFHDVEAPTSRVGVMRWPHQTAVMRETQTGQLYAVDSWFHDNGRPAEIIPLEQWKDGWKPGILNSEG